MEATGAGPGDNHMAAGDVEEARHIRNIFAALVALPRQPSVQPELTTHADGADGANVSHAVLLAWLGRVAIRNLAVDVVLAKADER